MSFFFFFVFSTGYDHQIEEKNIYAMTPGLKSFSDWLLQVIMTGDLEVIFPASTREYAPRIEELVKDSGFRAAYDRRNELCALPTVANYFLDRVSYLTTDLLCDHDHDLTLISRVRV